jgi:hypothetical protein
MRILYSTDIEIRKFFILSRGIELINDLITIWDFEILNDLILNLEKLFYVYFINYKIN